MSKRKTKPDLAGKTCEADYKVYGTPCGKPATIARPAWRFGDKAKGEPLVVHEPLYLCGPCAGLYDDIRAEARAEARGS